MGSYFIVAFCFIRVEERPDYYRALSTFKNQTVAPSPRVFVSDVEDALKNAARDLWPKVTQLLCVWHVNKNVLTMANKTWRTANGTTKEEKEAISKRHKDFMTRWHKVVYSKTDQWFIHRWDKLIEDYQLN